MESQRENWRQSLAAGIQAMDMSLSDEVQTRLLNYLALLAKWNRAYNLSAIRGLDEMVSKHLLDSLRVVCELPEESALRIADVGTGGGLPGMVLAIIRPDCYFTLIDSAGKKTRFLQQTAFELGLDNVAVINDRVENVPKGEGFHIVVSRAFASLLDMVSWCDHLLLPEGRFFAMKGKWPQDELDALPPCFRVEACPKFTVPGIDGERCLIVLSKDQ